VVRGLNVASEFSAKLKKFDKATKMRLRYYARFQPPADGVRLWVRCPLRSGCRFRALCMHQRFLHSRLRNRRQGLSGATKHSGDRAFFNEVLRVSSPLPPSGAPRADAALAALGETTAHALTRSGLHLWTGGTAHAEWRAALRRLPAHALASPGAESDCEDLE
jgi:hypothetical protein